MATDKLEKPRIPIEIFRKMIGSLSPAELRALPPEKLPMHIPEDVIEDAPYEMQKILEDLVFSAEAHQMNERMEIESRFGIAAVDAVELSRQGGSSTLNRMFKGRIEKLQLLHTRWEASESQEDLRSLIDNIYQLDDLLPLVREDGASITRSCAVLQELIPRSEEFQVTFAEAKQTLVSYLHVIDECLGEYFVVRLMVMGVELQRTATHVEGMDTESEQIDKDVRMIQRSIKNIINVQKIPENKISTHPEVQNLQNQLAELQRQKESTDVLISEKDLIEWLDLIVDASLSPTGQEKLDGRTKDMRMALFQLLVRYCKSQEDAARQVAKNPFSQSDPEQTIRFMLKSEEFVLDYFANKRRNLTEWLGEAAQKKMDSLQDIEDSMLSTMKDQLDTA
jgi:hypothetical protein